MADRENTFNPFRTVSIITLVVIVLLFVLALFNQHKVMFCLFGYRYEEALTYLIVIWAFLAGAVFVAALWILYAIKNMLLIKSLKKKIQDLNDKLNPTLL